MKENNIQIAYNAWSELYDDNANKTRDLEAEVLRALLKDVPINACLEMGCGTGKNTVWLKEKASFLLATDLSVGMLTKAREKVTDEHVHFVQADMKDDWDFVVNRNGTRSFDMVVFSLVLEHIDDLGDIFQKVAAATMSGGRMYIGELHPYKQYTGTKARFDTAAGRVELLCFNHHLSDFVEAAEAADFELEVLREYFDDGDRSNLPRILAMIFRKK
jgi:predicted TPR repeat methyltransferase